VLVLPVVIEFLGFQLRSHGLASLLPGCRADLSVFAMVLECLHQSQSFLDISTDSQIIDTHVPNILLVINDESSS